MVSFQNIYILYEFRCQSKAKLLEKLTFTVVYLYTHFKMHPF